MVSKGSGQKRFFQDNAILVLSRFTGFLLVGFSD
jgi:hypothetical protein